MSEANRSDGGTLPQSVERRVYQVCRRFDSAWSAAALEGPRPCVGDYINDVAGLGRLALLRGLLCLDVEYRRKAGERPAPEDYLSQFPDQAELIHAALSQPKDESTGSQVATGSASEPLPDVPGYKVLERIGWGGMGEVWRCRDHDLPRYLAMKTLKEKYREDANFSSYCLRLQKEARVLGELQHPGIVPIIQSGTLADGRPFFVMKLVKGRTLAQLLEEKGPGAAQWLGVFAAICQAVAYAHSRGVVHRDLKLSNVMVGEFGEVQVMDWGLVKVLPQSDVLRGEVPAVDWSAPIEWHEGSTQTYGSPEADGRTARGSVMGTWEFMPPEQARGLADEADQRSDVFGLGAILCAILTGQPPYVGPTSEDVQRQASQADLAGAYERLKECGADADLIELAKRCLAVEPEDRPQDAGDVAKEVAAYLIDVENRKHTAEKELAAANARAEAQRRARLWLAASIAAGVLSVALLDWFLALSALREREWQMLQGNLSTARSVANTFDAVLKFWSSAVLREAKEGGLRDDLQKRALGNLKDRMEKIDVFYKDPAHGFARKQGESPFASWFIVDGEGFVLAHGQVAAGDIVGQSAADRDYFLGACKMEAGSLHISRVYLGRKAPGYKFALAAPIKDDKNLLGVLVATVMTDSAEETLLPKEAPQKAVLVGGWDGTPPEKPDPDLRDALHRPGQRLILLHPAFVKGEQAVEIHNERLLDDPNAAGHGLDDHYEDPVATKDPSFAGRWLAAAASVPGTEFAVIVQQEYEAVQAEAIMGRPFLLWLIILPALLFIGATSMVWAAWRRNRLLAPTSVAAEPRASRGDQDAPRSLNEASA